jgi:hypothetical protein
MKRSLLLALAFAGAQAFAAATESTRCAQYNDSLDGTQANLRASWAIRCYPFLRGLAEPNGQFLLRDTASGANFAGYPIFAEIMPNGDKVHVRAPIDSAAPCWDTNKYQFAGICRAGCFTPDQRILVGVNYMPIKQAKDQGLMDLPTLSAAVGADPQWKISRINSYTVDAEDQEQKILVISTEEGGQLKVTTNHPLVDGEGYMREAAQLKVGDALHKVEGGKSVITAINSVSYFGKVYNVETNSTDLLENIIGAEGYLSGTVYYQNEGIKDLNRQVLRLPTTIHQSVLQ